MGNTFFYRDVKNNPDKISFKDILSECRKKHDKRDFEYQISAGSSINQATELDMLQKWKKPWIFYRMMIGGFILIAALFAAYTICQKVYFAPFAITLLAVIIPPIIIPLTITVFFWELNIPRNISIYEVALSFLTGGLLSITITIIMDKLITLDGAQWAPVTEEPAKLLAAVIIVLIIAKKKKIYGLTGLIIGGAVGAGFAAFESAQYVFNYMSSIQDYFAAQYGTYLPMSQLFNDPEASKLIFKFFIQNRFIIGFGTHTVWCASYTAAVTLHMNKSKLSTESFFNLDFLLMFAGAFITHYVNNSDEIHNALGIQDTFGYVIFAIALVVIEWFILFYIMKRCLYQAVSRGRYQSGEGIGYTQAVGAMQNDFSGANAQMAAAFDAPAKITVVCINGSLKGAVWQSSGRESLTIGREEGNIFRLPSDVAGISRQHCLIRFVAGRWTIKDLNSSYGTYINKVKLAPGEEQKLREGDIIYLANSSQAFKVTYQG